MNKNDLLENYLFYIQENELNEQLSAIKNALKVAKTAIKNQQGNLTNMDKASIGGKAAFNNAKELLKKKIMKYKTMQKAAHELTMRKAMMKPDKIQKISGGGWYAPKSAMAY